jgi:hypothetical protein
MAQYSWSVSPGFATNENIDLINNDIDTQVLDNTRLSTENLIGSISVTFSTELSPNSILIVNEIFRIRDNRMYRGNKAILMYPQTTVKTPIFKIIGSIPYQVRWYITNIEVTSYMSSGLTSYTIQVYDTTNSEIIAEKEFFNTESNLNDLGIISNLPQTNSTFEVYVKTNGSKSANAYIENIIITYNQIF